ncbi:uncharacterized protein LOC136039752 [Artemia franciscana]|uniref:uncharacterized protein LOC136039752 n=1 Tax=Artemia franciscana TaxID=6661 RepID=UPI0032DB7F76
MNINSGKNMLVWKTWIILILPELHSTWCQDTSSKCNHDEFKCANGACITSEYQCDGYNDCTDFSDEYNCTKEYESKCGGSGQFMCEGDCLPGWLVCNGLIDCDSGVDEAFCSSNEESIPKLESRTGETKTFQTEIGLIAKEYQLPILETSVDANDKFKLDNETQAEQHTTERMLESNIVEDHQQEYYHEKQGEVLDVENEDISNVSKYGFEEKNDSVYVSSNFNLNVEDKPSSLNTYLYQEEHDEAKSTTQEYHSNNQIGQSSEAPTTPQNNIHSRNPGAETLFSLLRHVSPSATSKTSSAIPLAIFKEAKEVLLRDSDSLTAILNLLGKDLPQTHSNRLYSNNEDNELFVKNQPENITETVQSALDIIYSLWEIVDDSGIIKGKIENPEDKDIITELFNIFKEERSRTQTENSEKRSNDQQLVESIETEEETALPQFELKIREDSTEAATNFIISSTDKNYLYSMSEPHSTEHFGVYDTSEQTDLHAKLTSTPTQFTSEEIKRDGYFQNRFPSSKSDPGIKVKAGSVDTQTAIKPDLKTAEEDTEKYNPNTTTDRGFNPESINEIITLDPGIKVEAYSVPTQTKPQLEISEDDTERQYYNTRTNLRFSHDNTNEIKILDLGLKLQSYDMHTQTPIKTDLKISEDDTERPNLDTRTNSGFTHENITESKTLDAELRVEGYGLHTQTSIKSDLKTSEDYAERYNHGTTIDFDVTHEDKNEKKTSYYSIYASTEPFLITRLESTTQGSTVHSGSQADYQNNARGAEVHILANNSSSVPYCNGECNTLDDNGDWDDAEVTNLQDEIENGNEYNETDEIDTRNDELNGLQQPEAVTKSQVAISSTPSSQPCLGPGPQIYALRKHFCLNGRPFHPISSYIKLYPHTDTDSFHVYLVALQLTGGDMGVVKLNPYLIRKIGTQKLCQFAKIATEMNIPLLIEIDMIDVVKIQEQLSTLSKTLLKENSLILGWNFQVNNKTHWVTNKYGVIKNVCVNQTSNIQFIKRFHEDIQQYNQLLTITVIEDEADSQTDSQTDSNAKKIVRRKCDYSSEQWIDLTVDISDFQIFDPNSSAAMTPIFTINKNVPLLLRTAKPPVGERHTGKKPGNYCYGGFIVNAESTVASFLMLRKFRTFLPEL